VETVDNSRVCEPPALRAQGSHAGDCRGATLSGRARPANPPNVRADLDLRGAKVELRVHENLSQAGARHLAVAAGQTPAVWWGELTAAPAFTHCSQATEKDKAAQ